VKTLFDRLCLLVGAIISFIGAVTSSAYVVLTYEHLIKEEYPSWVLMGCSTLFVFFFITYLKDYLED